MALPRPLAAQNALIKLIYMILLVPVVPSLDLVQRQHWAKVMDKRSHHLSDPQAKTRKLVDLPLIFHRYE